MEQQVTAAFGVGKVRVNIVEWVKISGGSKSQAVAGNECKCWPAMAQY
jgi:hypothetical protein